MPPNSHSTNSTENNIARSTPQAIDDLLSPNSSWGGYGGPEGEANNPPSASAHTTTPVGSNRSQPEFSAEDFDLNFLNSPANYSDNSGYSNVQQRTESRDGSRPSRSPRDMMSPPNSNCVDNQQNSTEQNSRLMQMYVNNNNDSAKDSSAGYSGSVANQKKLVSPAEGIDSKQNPHNTILKELLNQDDDEAMNQDSLRAPGSVSRDQSRPSSRPASRASTSASVSGDADTDKKTNSNPLLKVSESSSLTVSNNNMYIFLVSFIPVMFSDGKCSF